MQYRLFVVISFLLCLCLFIADLCIGSIDVQLSDIINVFIRLDSHNEHYLLLWHFRFPRAITAILAGCALSVSGLQMQAVFRNPLAGPYVLGVSSGASLGMALLLLAGSRWVVSEYWGEWTTALAAWIGAIGVLFLMLAVSLRVRDVLTVLVLGVMLGGAVSAIVNVLQFFADADAIRLFGIWNMGSLEGVTSRQLLVFAPSVLAGLVVSLLATRWLDVLAAGEVFAQTVGVPVRSARIIIFLSTGILAGSVTAFCGMVGFVGIAVPHIVRLFVGTANHRLLTWACILSGAVFMLLADIISHLGVSNIALPINSITAIMSIPVVIWVVIRNQRFGV